MPVPAGVTQVTELEDLHWPHGAKDVQGSLTQAISDTDRNLGIKLTVCLHFAPRAMKL